ncbi:MAG: tol-pal system protein YbgF, partial [Acidobacteriota bacterium]
LAVGGSELARELGEAKIRLPTRPSSDVDDDPRTIYDRAYEDYGEGNLDLAILGFRQYLEMFPDTEQSDNAAYWLGESYYRKNRFQQAIEEFDRVLTGYPGSDRAASSLLKKGYAYLEMGQRAQGLVQLQRVVCEFEGTDEALLASTRLGELGIDFEC